MQFSIRFVMMLFVVLAIFLAERTSGWMFFSETLWVLTPAVLVTLLLHGPRPNRIASAAALSTYLAILFSRSNAWSSSWLELLLVAAAWWSSRWITRA